MGVLESKNNGGFDFIVELAAGVGTMVYGISQTAWNITLSLLNVAFTLDLVRTLAETVNTIFSDIASSVLLSGIVVIIGFVALIVAGRFMLRGEVKKVLSTFLLFAIPVALLQLLTTVTSGAKEGEVPRWSPAWIALAGSDVVNTIGGDLLFNLANRAQIVTAPESNYFDVSPGVGNSVDCRQYVSVLNARYEQFQGVEVVQEGEESVAKTAFSQSGRNAMLMVSSMWESAYLYNFVTAQYGDFDMGMEMVCKQLEMQRGTPTDESYALVGGVYDRPDAYIPPGGGPFANWGPRPFTTFTPDLNNAGAAQVFAWSACRWEQGTQLAPGWNVLGGERDSEAAEAISNEACAAWSRNAPVTNPNTGALEIVEDEQGTQTGKLLFNEDLVDPRKPALAPENLKNAMLITTPTSSLTAQERDDLARVASVYNAYNGQNIGQRFISSFTSVVASLLYLWSFGLLAIGVIVAQVGLVLLLALLPISLILAALPSESRQNNPGVRLLKLTGAMVLTKLVLTATLALLVIVTAIINRVSMGLLPSNAGLLTAFAPIVAFIILRFILKKAGLGNITSLGGALGAMKGAAAQATGDSKSADGFRSADGRGSPAAVPSGIVRGRVNEFKRRRDRKKYLEQKEAFNAKKLAKEEKARLASPQARAEERLYGRKETDLQNGKRLDKARKRMAQGLSVSGLGAYVQGGDSKNIQGGGNTASRVSDKKEAARLREAAGVTAAGGLLAGWRADSKKRRKSLHDGANKLSMSGKSDSDIVTLTDAEAEKQAADAARALGIPRENLMSSHTGLSPYVKGGGSDGLLPSPVMKPDGTFDYEATMARAGTSVLMPDNANTIVANTAAAIRAANIPGLDSNDAERLALHVVGHRLGLADADGAQVRIEDALELTDKEIQLAVEMAADGKVHPKIAEFRANLDQQISANFETMLSESIQEGVNLAGRYTPSAIGSVENLTVTVEGIQDVISDNLGSLDARIANLPSPTKPDKLKERDMLVAELRVDLETMAREVGEAYVARQAALSTAEVSLARGRGEDDQHIQNLLDQAQKDLDAAETIRKDLVKEALSAASSLSKSNNPQAAVQQFHHELRSLAEDSVDARTQQLLQAAQDYQRSLDATRKREHRSAPFPD